MFPDFTIDDGENMLRRYSVSSSQVAKALTIFVFMTDVYNGCARKARRMMVLSAFSQSERNRVRMILFGCHPFQIGTSIVRFYSVFVIWLPAVMAALSGRLSMKSKSHDHMSPRKPFFSFGTHRDLQIVTSCNVRGNNASLSHASCRIWASDAPKSSERTHFIKSVIGYDRNGEPLFDHP